MAKSEQTSESGSASSVTELLTVPEGRVSLAAYDTSATPGFDGGKAKGKAALLDMEGALSNLQERLFAHGRSGSERRILLVLQGMDTAGKGGVMRNAVALVDPQGVHINAFKAPTEEERRHDFLWRVRNELPDPGMIGIFDRSHYEDVLVARVRQLVPADEIEARYDVINRFEKELADSGTTVLKCMLHISAEEQRQRLLARLDDPTKHWKFNPADLDERARWSSYQEAYEVAIDRCNTDVAPWLIVPSDRKWYRDWAIASVLRETLDSLGLGWPVPDFDVEEQRRRLTDEGFPDCPR